MGFATEDHMVRVDLWKDSGKWYDTVALKWDRYETKKDNAVELIHETFRRCFKEQFFNHYMGMRATCLEPYHEHSHPLSIIISVH